MCSWERQGEGEGEESRELSRSGHSGQQEAKVGTAGTQKGAAAHIMGERTDW